MSPQWVHSDLTTHSQAPLSISRPFAYVTPNSVARVLYFGRADGHIYELRLERGHPWTKADLTADSHAPEVALDTFEGLAFEGPFAYVTPDSVARVLYVGRDAHIHELRLERGRPWAVTDLTADSNAPDISTSANTGDAPGPTGGPFAYVTPDSVARVLYVGKDGHIHELRLERGRPWAVTDLTADSHAPGPVGPLFAYVTPDSAARVLYPAGVTSTLLGTSHIHELRLERGRPWAVTDLTADGHAPDAQNPNYNLLFAYVTPDSVARVLYYGEDGHIHELRLERGRPWAVTDLTADSHAPKAGLVPAGPFKFSRGAQFAGPFAYVTPDSVARVLYETGGDVHIHELRLERGRPWAVTDVTADSRAPVQAASRPFAYVTPDSVARVLYLGVDEHIHELRLI